MAASSVKKSTIREYSEALLIALIFVNFARIFVFQAFKIPTASMEDNLLVGDHIIVNKFLYGPPGSELFDDLFAFREIERGDIVVFRYPVDPAVDYVKRVVALPGETVSIEDKQVYVDGRKLDEPYVVFEDPNVYPDISALPEVYRIRDQFRPYKVPPGSYFVMGDNRDRSYDSRYWGPVARELIKGKPFIVYWSFEAPPSYGTESVIDRVKSLLAVVINFIPGTRWDRTFFIIDSEYHYRARDGDG